MVTILKEFQKLSTGNFNDVNWELAKPFTYNVAKCIGEQKKRLGGNFVAAQAIHSRDVRDVVRKVLPGSIFITLTLTKENQMKRQGHFTFPHFYFVITDELCHKGLPLSPKKSLEWEKIGGWTLQGRLYMTFDFFVFFFDILTHV